MCPHCGKSAPLIHRGLTAYCTACGRERTPFAGTSVSLAGKPSKVGGTVAGVLGWLVLIGGTATALLLGLLATWLFETAVAGLSIGLPIGFIAVAIGLLLLISGRKLARSGEKAERTAQAQAIFSLAAHRRRPLTAHEVGLALDLPTPEADALLTQLAKERPEEVTVDIGERGEILYGFPGVMGQPRVRFSTPPLRIDPSRAAAGGANEPALSPDEEEVYEGMAGVPRRREHLR